MSGIRVAGEIEKVTDGDTLRILAQDRLFKVRVLGLDTEESNPNPHKPVTKWGKAASDFAASILPVGTPVEIEFPGTDPVIINNEINVAYLDNFERPLGYVHLASPVEGITDYSELMIRKGFSPYFVKYGRAIFDDHNARYSAAERAAQTDDIGVWNQLEANDVVNPEAAPRNYARLMVWWELRARIIDEFRAARLKPGGENMLNSRLHYDLLLQMAANGDTATVFMELRAGRTVSERHHVIDSGSLAQPFQLFLRDEDRPEIIAVKNLLANRYIADGEDSPRRNYAFVTGPLKTFDGRPEMEVDSIDQISDAPPVPTMS